MITSMAITEDRVHFVTNKGIFIFMDGRLFRKNPDSGAWDTISRVKSVDNAIEYLEGDVKMKHDAEWRAHKAKDKSSGQ